jgi:hypothetical protein
MHSTIDAYGHDLVLECGDVLRHVQLKARRLNGATRETNINVALADRPSGRVIWTSYGRRPGVSAVLGTAHLLALMFGPISCLGSGSSTAAPLGPGAVRTSPPWGAESIRDGVQVSG